MCYEKETFICDKVCRRIIPKYTETEGFIYYYICKVRGNLYLQIICCGGSYNVTVVIIEAVIQPFGIIYGCICNEQQIKFPTHKSYDYLSH